MKLKQIIQKIGYWLCGLSVGSFLLVLPIIGFIKLKSFKVLFTEGWSAAVSVGKVYQPYLWIIFGIFALSMVIIILTTDND